MKLKTEHAQELDEAERRSGIKIKDLQERIEIEKQAWEENLLKKQDADIMTRERKLREQLRQERDRVSGNTCTVVWYLYIRLSLNDMFD